jgi:hypothetical protein
MTKGGESPPFASFASFQIDPALFHRADLHLHEARRAEFLTRICVPLFGGFTPIQPTW